MELPAERLALGSDRGQAIVEDAHVVNFDPLGLATLRGSYVDVVVVRQGLVVQPGRYCGVCIGHVLFQSTSNLDSCLYFTLYINICQYTPVLGLVKYENYIIIITTLVPNEEEFR